MSNQLVSRQQLIDDGQPLVYSLASRIYRTVPVRVDLDDLIAYGELGLAEAARDFDASQGVRFTTFAYYRVRGAIYDGLSKMSWTSRGRYRKHRFQQMANEVLQADSDRSQASERSVDDDANWFGNVTENLAVVYMASQLGNEDQDWSLEDAGSRTAPATLAQQEISQKLIELIDTLPKNEQRLIRTVYFDGATLQDAANILGISKSWASRMHAKILEQLGRSLRQLGAD